MVKLLIIGYGRHGKDTVSEYMAKKYNMKYNSSSWHCAANVCYPALKRKYKYKSVKECFDDRSNHRAEWYDLISAYCDDDHARIGREIFSFSNIYCGVRNKREFRAIRNNGLYDYSIWVDRSDHLPPEDPSSNTLSEFMADFTIDNNGTLDQLYKNIDDLNSFLYFNDDIDIDKIITDMADGGSPFARQVKAGTLKH